MGAPMADLQSWAPAFLAGLALGAIFFGGLWWTIRAGLTASQPALWFLCSLLLRTGTALGGFFLVAGTDWTLWLVCLIGFIAARAAVHRLTQAGPARLTDRAGDAS